MYITPWEELSRETIVHKYGRGIERVMYKMPDGTLDEFYLKHERSSVGVFALTKDQQVILVRQYRPGPRQIIDDTPGGYIDEGEEPHDAAVRELFEETGYAGNLKIIAHHWSCAYSNAVRYCALATDCELVGQPKLDHNEFADVVLMSLDEFKAHLSEGNHTYIETAYAGLRVLGM